MKSLREMMDLVEASQTPIAESGIELPASLQQQPAKKQTKYHMAEPAQDKINLGSIPGLNLGSDGPKPKTRLGGGKSVGIQAPDTTKNRGIVGQFKDRVKQKMKDQGMDTSSIDEEATPEAVDQINKLYQDKQ